MTAVTPNVHAECDEFFRNSPYFKPKSKLKNIFDSIMNGLAFISSKLSSAASSLKGRLVQLFAKPKETFNLGLTNEDIISGASIDSQAYTLAERKRQCISQVSTAGILVAGAVGACWFIKDLVSWFKPRS